MGLWLFFLAISPVSLHCFTKVTQCGVLAFFSFFVSPKLSLWCTELVHRVDFHSSYTGGESPNNLPWFGSPDAGCIGGGRRQVLIETRGLQNAKYYALRREI